MSNDLLRTLRREFHELEDKLEKNPDYKRLKMVQALLSEYQENAETADGTRSLSADSATANVQQDFAAGDSIRETAYDILREFKKPLPLRNLMDEINMKGLRIAGANPTANLSTQLSRDDRFVSHGRQGWTITKFVQADESQLDQILEDLREHLCMDAEMQKALSTHIEKNRLGIPSEVDGWLLRQSTQYFDRRLIEDEKGYLREKVRQKARSGEFNLD